MGSQRVLIVDDALIIRQRIRQIAEAAGWNVAAEAANGKEAVAMYKQYNPDLVTLDIVMPELDGVEALKQIIALDLDASVVMVSAVSQKGKLSECIRAGAIDFIVKPFDRASLQAFFAKRLTANN